MTADDLQGKNLVELLDLLEPVREPVPVSMWPQTQGWVVLGLAGLALMLWLALKWRAAYRTNAYRRAALAALSVAGDDPVAVADILRRAALAAYPRDAVAGISGAAWLGFLDRTYGGTGFTGPIGRCLAVAPYRAAAAEPVAGLKALATDWIRLHEPAKAKP